MLNRSLTPEILDSLPEDHSDAIQSRRDIQKFNFIQGNHRWFLKQIRLLPKLRSGDHIVEIGSGNGTLGRYLKSKNVIPDDVAVTGLDLAPRPKYWPEDWNWIQGCAFSESHLSRPATHVLANLTLHHFTEEQLGSLSRHISKETRAVLASETLRSRISLALLPLARLMMINHVTRHDARVSLEGGFRGDELPKAVRLSNSEWFTEIRTHPLGSYRLRAVRTLDQ